MRTVMMAVAVAVALCAGPGPATAQKKGQPGDFDYYLLSLSWSPAHCARQKPGDDPDQCGPDKRFGFVVHGLWPQHDEGGYPQRCDTGRTVSRAVVDAMMPVMPSVPLIVHQWQKHGTCSGLDLDTYFARTRAAFDRIAVPKALAEPADGMSMTADEVEAQFVQANPGLTPDMVAVICERRGVSEVRICLDKELSPRRCAGDVADRCNRGARLTAGGR